MKKKIKIRQAAVFSMMALLLAAGIYAGEVNAAGKDIVQRFPVPAGYERVKCAPDSFGAYLRTYPLKEYGAPVLLYDGTKKRHNVHVSVFDMPILKQDLIQCADAVIKLRAEYLYRQGRYNEIQFHITNGMAVPFSRYAAGERVIVSGSKTAWKGGYKAGTGRDVFEEYLKFIYSYAGTLSLSREASAKSVKDIAPGDFFIFGGSPGHVVLVLDVAQSRATGKKIMILGQSYMPSQEFHVLKSYESISPWYYVSEGSFETPEWVFNMKEGSALKTF